MGKRQVAPEPVVVPVPPQHAREMRPLHGNRVVPVSATPVVDGSHRACEAALGRGLAHDRVSLPRPHPVMGEAQEVECRAHPVPSGPVRSEVQVPRLVRVEP